MHVAASLSGVGVLKDYEWEPLGITLEFERRPRVPNPPPVDPSNPPPGIEALTVVLHNYGEKDLAIVDLPGDRSFRLVPNDRWGSSHYSWVGDGRALKAAAPTAANVIVLKPGDVHKRRIDLTDPYWWIIDTKTAEQNPFPLRDVKDQWSASFRIEYAPPDADELAGLQDADIVRHGALRSRAFSANRYVD